MGKEWFLLEESVPAGGRKDISKQLKKGEKMKGEGGIGIQEKKDDHNNNNNNKKKKKEEGGIHHFYSSYQINDEYLASCYAAAAFGKKRYRQKKQEKAAAMEYIRKFGPIYQKVEVPFDLGVTSTSQPGI